MDILAQYGLTDEDIAELTDPSVTEGEWDPPFVAPGDLYAHQYPIVSRYAADEDYYAREAVRYADKLDLYGGGAALGALIRRSPDR